jgi:hypothetical protein
MANDADRLRAELPSAPSHNAQPIVEHAAQLLDQVDNWIERKSSLRERWTGEGSSRAWLQLHEAEAELAGTLPEEVALAWLPDALADARSDIGDDDDPAVREATCLYFETYVSRSSSAGRPKYRSAAHVLEQLLRRRYQVIFDRQGRALALRNRIIRLIVVMLGLFLVLFLIAVGAGDRLHWSPEGITTKATNFPVAWLTLLCVIVFGVLGGLISAIPVLARPPTSPDPYGLAVSQGVLKLPLGGVTAVIGCLALQSGTLPGVTGVTSLAGLLFWAAAFGAGQQAVSRLLDNQVGNLLNKPGPAVLPRHPAAVLAVPTADSTPPDEPRQTSEQGHTADYVQTSPSGTTLSEHESRTVSRKQ